MAKKNTKEENKIVLEREYVVPLHKKVLPSVRHKKSKKAVSILRQFIIRHMKSENVKILKELNDYIWKDGIKNPPHKVKVKAIKRSDGIVNVNLAVIKVKKVKDKKKKTDDKKEEKKEKIDDKVKVEEKPKVEDKKIEAKKEVKTEKKEEEKEVKPAVKKEEKTEVKKEGKPNEHLIMEEMDKISEEFTKEEKDIESESKA